MAISSTLHMDASYMAKAAKNEIIAGSRYYVDAEKGQEIYGQLGAYDGDFISGIYVRALNVYYMPDFKGSGTSGTSGVRIYFEAINGTLDPAITWDTRPSDSAATVLDNTLYSNITINNDISYKVTDAQMQNKVLNGQMYMRVRASALDNDVFLGIQTIAASLTYDPKQECVGQKRDYSTDIGQYWADLEVYDTTRATLNVDNVLRWAYRCAPNNSQITKLILLYSTDGGASWAQIYQDASITASSTSVRYAVAPRDSIPAGKKVIMRVELYNAQGHCTYWQKEYATTTTKPKVKITSPVQAYVDGAVALPVQWDYTGTYSQKNYTVQYTQGAPSSASRIWQTIVSLTSTAKTYTIPANTLPGGNVWIKVSATDVQGNTASDTSSIVVSAIPRVTNIRITPSASAPRITVGWDCSDQEAAQVRIDNGTTYDSGILFGKDKTHTPDVWLSNGSHTVSVRAQNRLGFWSPWANVTISTSNSGGAAITLNAVTVGQSINLSWATTGNYSQYIVMRDGVNIGTTKAKAYSDYYTAGTHTYRVRGLMTYTYTDSNNASATLYTAKAQIAAVVDNGVPTWIQLWLGTDPERTVNRSVAQTVAYTHYSGRDWPVAEVSEYRDETYSVTVALTNTADQKNFEALLGREVCYKRRDQAVIGLLDAYTARHTRSKNMVEYAYTIRRVDDEEDVI